jgi:hypothetical protein
MKVEELFAKERVELTEVLEMGDESDYHNTSANFIYANWCRDVETLSVRQAAWLTKILEDMIEKRIERRK